jgi:DNA invertase Pin-like site-specific DNA recombinase
MELVGLIYARISQLCAETDHALNNQVAKCESAAAVLGVPITHIFRERDSGHETADTRKDLLRARELVRARRVTHFLIHNFDRLSRTPEELVALWKEAQRHGVKVVVAMWPQFHELDLEMAKMMVRTIGMVGELEWSFIQARTTQNKQQIRNKGLVVGEGGPRFGFTWDRQNRAQAQRGAAPHLRGQLRSHCADDLQPDWRARLQLAKDRTRAQPAWLANPRCLPGQKV